MRKIQPSWVATHAALKKHHATQKMWATVESNSDADKAQAAEDKADKLVRMAFFSDTSDRNSLAACMAAPVQDIKRMTRWQPTT